MKLRLNIMSTLERTDRHTDMQRLLVQYPEFQPTYYYDPVLVPDAPPQEPDRRRRRTGAQEPWVNLMLRMQDAVRDCRGHEYCIIAEDDLELTPRYDLAKLNLVIEQAKALQADVLLTGVDFYSGLTKTRTNGLLEIFNFQGTHLIVIFNRFFDRFLAASAHQPPEVMIGHARGVKRLLTYPFLSYQNGSPSTWNRADTRQGYLDTEKKIGEWLRSI